MDDQKIDKNSCIIIGDSYESDIKGGENIGIKPVLIRKENRNNYKIYCKDLEGILEKIIESENGVRSNCT
jgi:ribonucleotide monophosphatase NagD (HAD superfamily)